MRNLLSGSPNIALPSKITKAIIEKLDIDIDSENKLKLLIDVVVPYLEKAFEIGVNNTCNEIIGQAIKIKDTHPRK